MAHAYQYLSQDARSRPRRAVATRRGDCFTSTMAQALYFGTTSDLYLPAQVSSEDLGLLPCTSTSVATWSSGPKNLPPSGIQGRATADASTGWNAEITGLFFTESSSYADLRVGSRPSSSERNACDSAELMKSMNAIAAS